MLQFEKNYLTNVILRIDFASAQNFIGDDLDKDIKELCIKYFPLIEKRELNVPEIQLKVEKDTISDSFVNQTKQIEWHFLGKSREKEFTVTNHCLVLEYRDYDNFENFSKDFFGIYNGILMKFNDIKINRIGLRYIDQIEIKENKKSTWYNFWKRFISDKLIKGIDFLGEDDCLARHMSVMEMNYNDYMLRLQYGIHNQDYPAVNKKPIFIFDTDFYAVGLYETNDVESFAKLFNIKAQEIFEKAITKKLKDRMGVLEHDGESTLG